MNDPITIASTVLSASLRAPVRADRVGHSVGSPLVLVALSGVDRVVRHRLERVDYTAHCSASFKEEALSIAMSARSLLLDVDPHAVPGVVIVDSFVTGPSDLPNEDTREQRFILNFTLYYYTQGVSN